MKIQSFIKIFFTKNGICSVFNFFKLRSSGVKCTLKTFVHGKLYIKAKGEIEIGEYFTYSSGNALNPLDRNIRGSLTASKGASIKIGNHVSVSSGCIWARECITIGNNCMIGSNVIIIDSDEHSLNYIERRTDTGVISSAPVEIGDDVWIGTSVIILKGVHIGHRTIIGAGSVVTKDIPNDCIAAGNPCKVIKYLNNQKVDNESRPLN